MAITTPAVTQPLAVRAGQALTLESDAATNWWARTNGGSWSQINGGGTTASLVWSVSSSVTRRFTFDEVQVVAQASSPSAGETGGLHLNVCEGPVAGLQVTPAVENPAMQAPDPVPNARETDDPPLGLVLDVLAANRDGLATLASDRPAQPGGPADLVARYGRGLAVDTSGHLVARSGVAPRVSGLGPFPAIASYHHDGLYFSHDFGKSRALSLTRVLYEDGDGNVAVVRGDGRRHTYRWNGSSYDAAAGLQSELTQGGGWGEAPWGTSAYGGGASFEETTPSGRVYTYDGDGVLESVEDRYGNEVTYVYDANGRLQKVRGASLDASGLVPYLSYDSNGLLERLVLEDLDTPANNRTTYFDYDADKNLTKITGPEGCVTSLSYAGTGGPRLSGVEDAENYAWSVSYDGSNRVSQITDPRTNSANFAYDTAVPLTTHRDRVGKATYYRYNAWGFPEAVFNVGTPGDYFVYDDAHGNLTQSTNRKGEAWDYVYDPRGNRIKSTDPLGAVRYFAYDGQDLLKRYDDPVGGQTFLSHDAVRNCTQREDALGEISQHGWHPQGLLYYTRDRRGAFTYLFYDAAANQTKLRDAHGEEVTVAYNSAGQPTSVTDPLSRVTVREYDLKGRLTKRVDPAGGANYLAYDGRCNLVSTKDPRLQETLHSYDGNSNLTRSVDALGNANYLDYDAEDRVSRRTDPLDNKTNMAYDTLGRLETQTDALGAVSRVVYDDAHQPVLQLDPLDNPSYLAYDKAGRVQFQTTALQEETYFGYDLKGRLVKQTDARENSTVRAYDALDRLTSSTDAIGAVRSATYDEEGNVLRRIAPKGNTTYYTYDLKGRQVHIADQLKQNTYVGYDAADQVYYRRDQLGAFSYYFYDLAGRQVRSRDAYREEKVYAYDLAGNLESSTDELGFSTTHTYDAANRRTETEDAYGNAAKTVYDRASNVTRQIDELGFTTYHRYDVLNRLSHTTDGVHFASTYMGYDLAGNAVLDVDQAGNASYMSYDALNRVAFVHDRAGALTYSYYDRVGNPVRRHVHLGAGGEQRVSYLTYDAVNRVQKQLHALSGETYFGYDLAGNRTLLVDAEERPTYLAYDVLDRVEIRTDSVVADEWRTVYDARSQVIQEIDPENRYSYMGYDDLGRKTHTWNLLGQVTYMGYDARSQQVLELSPKGNSTYFHYDRLGRQSRRVDALLGEVYLGYDPVGNQVLQLDELENPTYFRYDGLRRLSRVIDAELKETYLGYDARSNQVLKVQAEGGESTYMAYDAAGRLETRWFTTDAPHYFSYDQVGNVVLAEDDSGADTVVEYDKLDRVTKKVTLAGAVYFAYDKSGKRTQLKDPDLNVSDYVWDSRGRLEKIQLAAGRTAYFDYDRSGKLTERASPNDINVAAYTYDVAGRVSEVHNQHHADGDISVYRYTRDALGQVLEENTYFRPDVFTRYYEYDAKERLTHEYVLADLAGSYYAYDLEHSYDLASNRTKKHDAKAGETTYFSYDERNTPTEEWNKTTGATRYYSYDDSQRLASQKATGADQSSYYTHDQLNRATLIEFAKASSPDTDREFSYNALGERVRVVDGQGETYWAYDGEKVLRQGKPDGSALRTYRHNMLGMPQGVPQNLAGASLLELLENGYLFYPAFNTGGMLAHVGYEFPPFVDSFYLHDSTGTGINFVSNGVPFLFQTDRAHVPGLKALNAFNAALYLTQGGQVYMSRLALLSHAQGLLAGQDRELGPQISSAPLPWWLLMPGAVKQAALGRNFDPGGDARVRGESEAYQSSARPELPPWLSVEMQGNQIVTTLRFNLVPGRRIQANGGGFPAGTVEGAEALVDKFHEAVAILNRYSPEFIDPMTGEKFRLRFVDQFTVSAAARAGYRTITVYDDSGTNRENRIAHATISTMPQEAGLATVLHEFVHFMGTTAHEDDGVVFPKYGFMAYGGWGESWELWTRYYRIQAWRSLAIARGISEGSQALDFLMSYVALNSEKPVAPNYISAPFLRRLVQARLKGNAFGLQATYRDWYWLDRFIARNPTDRRLGNNKSWEESK